eukprot:9469738-Pyramimonas_sp.AAC.1
MDSAICSLCALCCIAISLDMYLSLALSMHPWRALRLRSRQRRGGVSDPGSRSASRAARPRGNREGNVLSN